MTEAKYLKSVSSYAENLYEPHDTLYTPEAYEGLIARHLESVKQSIEQFKHSYPEAQEIKVLIELEASHRYEDTHLDYETRITGKIPMTKKEQAAVDEGDRNRLKHQETMERQQLEMLLKKHPEYLK